MGFFGRLLGSPKALGETVKAVGDGLDRFVYTKEEKAENQAKAVTEGRNMLIRWMESTQGQNLSRRIIALSITFVWLLMFISGLVLAICAVWVTADSAKFTASSELIDVKIDQMTGAVMLILGFYFASPYLGQIATVAMDKFSKKKQTPEK